MKNRNIRVIRKRVRGEQKARYLLLEALSDRLIRPRSPNRRETSLARFLFGDCEPKAASEGDGKSGASASSSHAATDFLLFSLSFGFLFPVRGFQKPRSRKMSKSRCYCGAHIRLRFV